MPSVYLALLAEYAKPSDRAELLHVIGGGIRSVAFPAFPGVSPRLSLALGLEFTPAETQTPEHSLQITARGAGDRPLLKPLTASFTVRSELRQPDEPVYFHFVYNMENIVFPSEGSYVFSVTVDDKLVSEIPLRAQMITGPVPRNVESSERLNEGYAAFAAGDTRTAQTIFEEVVAKYPENAGGHNNLGFVLLAREQADAALAAFQKARELGYSRLELLDANLGCAHYLRGDATAAAIFFDQCIRSHGFEGTGLLCGINGSHLFLVQLMSASDYVSLMTLNAGWSALRSGDRVAAARYLEGAEAANLLTREDESGRNYAASAQALKETSSKRNPSNGDDA